MGAAPPESVSKFRMIHHVHDNFANIVTFLYNDGQGGILIVLAISKIAADSNLSGPSDSEFLSSKSRLRNWCTNHRGIVGARVAEKETVQAGYRNSTGSITCNSKV